MIDFGKWLRTARKEKRLTQKKLGAMAGYEYSTICNIEKGRSGGTWETASNIIEALGYEIRIVRKDAT